MRRAACIVAIFGALSVGTPAHASGPLIVYARKTVTIAALHFRTVEVACPAGRTLFGGGASFSSPQVSLMASFPDGLSGWIATANNPTRKGRSMSVVADCVDTTQLSGVTGGTGTNTGTAPALQTTTLTATCVLGGTYAVAGGFRVESLDPAIRVQTSKPTVAQDGWTVSVLNPTAHDVTFEYHSICIGGVPIAYSAVPKPIAAGTATTNAVACGFGRVVGGGFDISGGGTGVISSTRPTKLGSRRPGRGWAVTGRAGASAETLWTYTECVSP